MNDDKYKMKIEDEEEVIEEKEDKIPKYKLINIIIICAMGLNYLFIILLGSGLFDRSSSNIFETYFKLSFSLIPLIYDFTNGNWPSSNISRNYCYFTIWFSKHDRKLLIHHSMAKM